MGTISTSTNLSYQPFVDMSVDNLCIPSSNISSKSVSQSTDVVTNVSNANDTLNGNIFDANFFNDPELLELLNGLPDVSHFNYFFLYDSIVFIFPYSMMDLIWIVMTFLILTTC